MPLPGRHLGRYLPDTLDMPQRAYHLCSSVVLSKFQGPISRPCYLSIAQVVPAAAVAGDWDPMPSPEFPDAGEEIPCSVRLGVLVGVEGAEHAHGSRQEDGNGHLEPGRGLQKRKQERGIT